MDLNLRLRIEAEVAAARREIAAVNGDVKTLGLATKEASAVTMADLAQEFVKVDGAVNGAKDSAHDFFAELNQLAAGYDDLRLSVDQTYAAQTRYADGLALTRLAVASGVATEQEAATTLDMLAQKLGLVEAKAETSGAALQRHGMSSGAAAAASQNLAFQFNDVAVMAAAGQNPLMLAMQQGTQISQIFGQAGAAGALGLLKQGFMAFLSPTTLVTIALIAGGTALLQWAMGAGSAEGQTKSLTDAVADLESSVSDFRAKSSVSLEDLKAKFGEVTPEVIRLNDEMTNLAGAQAILAATEAMKSLKAETEGSWSAFLPFSDKALTDLNQAAALLQVDPLVSNLNNPNPEDNSSTKNNPAVEKFLAAVEDGKSAKGLDNQLAAVERIVAAINEATGGLGNMNGEQMALLAGVRATEAALRQMKAAQDDAGNAGQKSADAQQALLEKLQQAAAVQQAITKFGADSVQVAQLRLEGERKTFLAMLDSIGAAGEMRQNLIDAWEAGNKIADIDMAAGIIWAKAKAADLFAALSDAWDAAIGLRNAAPGAGWLASAIGQADTLAATLWNAVLAADAARTTNPTVTRLPGGVDAIARGEINVSGTNENGGANVTRRVPIVTSGSGAGSGGGGGGGGPAKGSLEDVTQQAKQSMDALDLAVAAINEKVEAGLMTTAEAAEAVASAKGQAADTLADLIAQLGKLGPAGADAASLIRSNMQGLAADLKTTGTDLAKTLSEGFKSPFKDFLTGAKTAEGAMDALGDFVIDKFAEMAAERAATGVFEPIMNSLISAAGGLFGGVAGGVGGGAVTLSPIPQARPFADGGVPDGAPLSAWRNQVLDRPTLFPMAQGMGLMAEAGREAIVPVGDGGVLAMAGGREMRLPLMRGPGGRLGVDLPDEMAATPDRAARPFADGGVPDGAPLSAWRNQVVDRPTLFGVARGMGLMAEAGREAIVPVGDGGVLAMAGGREMRLPLMRGPGGRLGVDLPEWKGSMIDRAPLAFAQGGIIQGGQSVPVGSYGSAGAGTGEAPKVTVNITTPAGQTAQVNDRMEGNNRIIDVLVEQVEGAMAANARAGRGALVAAMAATYDLRRAPR